MDKGIYMKTSHKMVSRAFNIKNALAWNLELYCGTCTALQLYISFVNLVIHIEREMMIQWKIVDVCCGKGVLN